MQKAYSLDKISRLMDEAGLEFINAYEYGTSLPPSETSERICIVAREKYQENKTYI